MKAVAISKSIIFIGALTFSALSFAQDKKTTVKVSEAKSDSLYKHMAEAAKESLKKQQAQRNHFDLGPKR